MLLFTIPSWERKRFLFGYIRKKGRCKHMLARFKSALVSEDGSLNLEMALIIALLILVAVVSLGLIATGVSSTYNDAATSLNNPS